MMRIMCIFAHICAYIRKYMQQCGYAPKSGAWPSLVCALDGVKTIEWGGQQCCDVMDDEDGEDDYEDEDYKDDDDEFETNDGFVGGTQPFGGEQFE